MRWARVTDARPLKVLVVEDESPVVLDIELRDRPILCKPIMLANLKRAIALARTGSGA